MDATITKILSKFNEEEKAEIVAGAKKKEAEIIAKEIKAWAQKWIVKNQKL